MNLKNLGPSKKPEIDTKVVTKIDNKKVYDSTTLHHSLNLALSNENLTSEAFTPAQDNVMLINDPFCKIPIPVNDTDRDIVGSASKLNTSGQIGTATTNTQMTEIVQAARTSVGQHSIISRLSKKS